MDAATAERTRAFISHTAQRCFAPCVEQLETGECGCTRSTKDETFVWRYGPCEFGCGPDDEKRTITIVKACPIHGALDLSKPVGGVRSDPPVLASTTTQDYTVEAQARLLMKMLAHASVDIVEGYAAFTGGVEVTPEEERLLRMLYGVAQP